MLNSDSKIKTKDKISTKIYTSGSSETGLGLWNVIQTWAKFQPSVFSNFGKGSVNVQSEMSLFDTIVFCSCARPARQCPFHPWKQLGPWPLQHWPSKPSSFQLRRSGNLPVPLPSATSHSAAEITLFILCIIVSSWMQELCRHLSELS